MPSSYASAQANGIVAGASDQTSAINTILANADYTGIIMDVGGGGITINGAVSANGKTILYYSGNYFTGGGTIDSQQIDAGYGQQLFDTSITLTNCTTATKMFSVMWYGAIGDYSTDNSSAFQAAVNTVIANTSMTRDLYFPPGVYVINSPLILYNWTGSVYGQYTINLIGDYSVQDSNLEGVARILPSFNDTFAIGVQRATCGMIFGLSIEGTFTYSEPFDTFVNTPFDSVPGAPRDSQYSPNAGIVIDPFTNGQSVPGSDMYPGLSSWYRGDNSDGGTTGFKISNCNIQGFTVDICYSPNGSTQQGEDCVIEDCQLNYANVAVAYCQSQSDNCYIDGLRSWYYVWTVVDTGTYGPRVGYVANMSRFNIAGAVNQIFNVGGDKSFIIERVYAESFFTIGNILCNAGGATVAGCTFDFAISPTNQQPAIHVSLQNAEVIGCRMRYYDDLFNKRLRIIGRNTKFTNTFFDQPPFITSQDESQYNTVKFEICSVGELNQILGMNNDTISVSTAGFAPVLYGNFKIQDGAGLDYFSPDIGYPISPAITYHYNCTSFNRYFIGFASGVTLTPDSDRSATFTSSYYYLAQVNDIIVDYVTGNVLGRISAINTSTITLSEIPINIISGGYYDNLNLVYYLTTANPIVGDITSGSASITNVSPLFEVGYINSLTAGSRFDHYAFANGTYIVSYDAVTGVLTMSSPANKTASRQNFINGNPDIEAKCIVPPNNSNLASFAYSLAGGTKWIELINYFTSSQSVPTIWIFNKGGYLNAVALGLSSAYQADFNIQPLLRNNSGTIQYYDTYADSWIDV
jgi:hypothetical protein